tara:strand:- start:928 stop:1497 length:570 start_codon:yes stop_codon:yes gene_type:complete
MDPSVVLLAVILAGLVGYLLVRDPARIGQAFRIAGKQGRVLVIRIPLAILAATFIAHLIPTEHISSWIGPDSGFQGILIACAVGAFIPGGPMLTFPLALVIWQLGAGQPQMVTLLAAWSIFAFHRVISYELPLLGPRFLVVRLASSFMLPALAGLIAGGLMLLWHGAGAPPETAPAGLSSPSAAMPVPD